MSQIVTSEQFVRSYMEWGGDFKGMAESLNLGENYLKARAIALRKRGVKLPANRHVAKLKVNSLNNIIKEYKKGQE